MRLPRWTTYPALALLASFLVTAVPLRGTSLHRGAAKAVREGLDATGSPGDASTTKYPRVVIFGIDGLDPDLLLELIRAHPERVPNFKKLSEEGSGVRELGTSTPPQSPVAWSNFITGLDPGKHGIFEFIHRDPRDVHGGARDRHFRTGEHDRSARSVGVPAERGRRFQSQRQSLLDDPR